MTYMAQTTTILIALALGLSGAALAGEPEMTLNELDQRTITVQFNDLNMDHADGVATLERRLVAASHRVCGQPQGRRSRNLALAQKRQVCYNRTISTALDNEFFASIDKKTRSRMALNIAEK